MSLRTTRVRLAALASLAVCALVAITASASGAPQAQKPSRVWTQADIDKVAQRSGVAPFKVVYNVPKQLPRRYKIGFVNPGLSVPFFAEWSRAMKAAARFYRVDFVEANANLQYDTETDLYDTLVARGIDAFGTHPGNTVIAQKAASAKIPFLTIDSQVPGASRLGIPDVQAGQIAAKLLTTEIKKRQQGSWKGKDIVFVGLGAPGCTPCEVRPRAAQRYLARRVEVSDSAFIPEYATPEVGLRFMTDVMTRHPDKVFAIVPLNDESLIGVVQALKNARRTQDAAIVSLGGDPAGRRLLRENPKMVFAVVDFNPFGEAWNFVAAAIARLQNASFKPYRLGTVLTPQNVDKLYPGDKK
jgi:ABC-type sugar transport system substrate-binding protein